MTETLKSCSFWKSERMKKITVLFVLYWLVVVYSGSSGRRIFKTVEKPEFIYEGRWIRSINKDGDEVYISAGSTVIFWEEKK